MRTPFLALVLAAGHFAAADAQSIRAIAPGERVRLTHRHETEILVSGREGRSSRTLSRDSTFEGTVVAADDSVFRVRRAENGLEETVRASQIRKVDVWRGKRKMPVVTALLGAAAAEAMVLTINSFAFAQTMRDWEPFEERADRSPQGCSGVCHAAAVGAGAVAGFVLGLQATDRWMTVFKADTRRGSRRVSVDLRGGIGLAIALD